MDSVTLIGVMASLFQIGDVVHKSIKRLADLRSAHHNLPLVVTTLIGQLYIIKVTLEHLASTWNSQNFTHHSHYQQVAPQMETALESFSPLMLSLQTKLEHIDDDQAVLTMKKKAWFLWHEEEMSKFCALIDRQVNALNLLLQVFQCRSWIEQQHIIDHEDNHAILQCARDCSSSIIGVPYHDHDRDGVVTELTDGMSVESEFDSLILGCRPYLSAHRSQLKKAIPDTCPIIGADNSQPRGIQPAFSSLTQEDNTDQHDVVKTSSACNGSQDLELLRGASIKPPTAQPRFDVVTEHIDLLKEIAASFHSLVLVNSPDMSKRKSQKSQNIDKDSSGTLRKTVRLRPRLKQASHSTDGFKFQFEREAKRQETKTLILGTSESAKSTLLKGLRYLLGCDYTRVERESFRGTVFDNLIGTCRTIIKDLEGLKSSSADKRGEHHYRRLLIACDTASDYLTPEVASAMKELWADGDFQAHLKQWRSIGNNNLEYYMQSIERLRMTEYLPSVEDILRARERTPGVTEHSFPVDGSLTRIVDVGGVRSARKKWVYCFENVNNVYFVVDAAAYGRPPLEDERADRMVEQLHLFPLIVNDERFVTTKFLLIFSRMDRLEQYLSAKHPATHFPDFEPAAWQRTPTIDEYMAYLERRFVSLIESPWHKKNIRVLRASLVDMKTLWAHREIFGPDAVHAL